MLMPVFSIPLTSPAGVLYAFTVRPTVPPVARMVIVHGYGDHSGRYREFMEFLSNRGIESAALDLRGHGKSPGPRGFVRRWDDYLDDVNSLLTSLPGDLPTFLLGHSHGGLVASAGLSRGRFPNVRGVVLVSTYFVNKAVVPFHKRLLAAFGNVFLPGVRVGTGLGDGMMTHDERMREESKNDPLLNRCATPRWFVSTVAAQKRLFIDAPAFTTPCLTLVGEADVVADPSGASRFHAIVGSSDKTLHVYPGLRHELLREVGRQEIFDRIGTWVSSRVSSHA